MKPFNKWLIIASVLLGMHLIFRLIDQAKMMTYFPLDFTNDISSYMAQLHFLKVCGFHQFCPYWYNGFTTFQFSPPGWYFFAYPLSLIFNSVQVAAYLSIVISLIAAFFLFLKLGKTASLSRIKSIAFFFLFFANASAIGNFIRLGRVHELLSWVLFIPFFFLIYYYHDKPIDKKFFLVIPLYASIILTYHSTAVLAGLVWLGFFFTRKTSKEVLKGIFALLVSFLFTSFWLVPFVMGVFQNSTIPQLKQGTWIWNPALNNLSINLSVLLIPLAFLILFFLFYKNGNAIRSNFLFFMPAAIFTLLFFLRLTPFLPVFDQIYPDPIVHFILFFAIFFFLKMEIPTGKIKQFSALLIIIVIASISLNIIYTPLFKIPNSEREKEFISYLPLIEDRFVITGKFPPEPYAKAFYSFAATKNKSSISGWYPEEKSSEYISRLANVNRAIDNNNCEEFKQELRYFNTTEVLSTKEYCERLRNCNLNEVSTKTETCFYNLQS